MKIFFSKRHANALREKKLPVTFSKSLRVSILRTLEMYSDCGGYDSQENFTFELAEEILKTFYGKLKLESFDQEGKRIPASLSGVILSGYPSEVIDSIEAWFAQEPKRNTLCEKELNEILTMNRSQWRFVHGEAILVDSEYLHEEVQARTLRLLKESRAFGALEEFQDAIRDLQSGETKDAVIKAHKSVESVMKSVLKIDEHKTFGHLLSMLIKSGIIPLYYEEFLQHFEKLALGAVKERNLPARGHGQGAEIVKVPKSLAEFAINLAGTINLFIIQQWLEIKNTSQSDGNISDFESTTEEIPF